MLQGGDLHILQSVTSRLFLIPQCVNLPMARPLPFRRRGDGPGGGCQVP